MSVEYDFIVVGSGAGGGPLACRLARDPAGYKVALVEAGSDPAHRPDGSDNYNYAIPVLHGHASEDPHMSWDFFVRHFSDDSRQLQDTKYYNNSGADPDPRRKGIFYPRAGTVGGCTAHNAMITVYPHNEDWEYLQQLTGDSSWSPENMRKHFQNLENCRYASMEPNDGKHGFGNWLDTSLIDSQLLIDALADPQFLKVAVGSLKAVIEDMLLSIGSNPSSEQLDILADHMMVMRDVMNSVFTRLPRHQQELFGHVQKLLSKGHAETKSALKELLPDLQRWHQLLDDKKKIADKLLGSSLLSDLGDKMFERFLQRLLGDVSPIELVRFLLRHFDPNDWRVVEHGLQGLYPIPLATDGARRSSAREFIQATLDNCPYRLELINNALATEIVFEGTRAVGLKILRQPNAYFASPLNRDRTEGGAARGEVQVLRARKEIILAGGTFNTPQLLMLSGIGPRKEVEKAGKSSVGGFDWPGVGKNLQCRYEVTVISDMARDFEVIKQGKFEAPQGDGRDDPKFIEWQKRQGVYTSNGAVFSVIKRTSQAEHIVETPKSARQSPPPDIFIFGVLGYFKGYLPGYSELAEEKRNRLTWAILKGHTRNTAGEITLRSGDPRDTPLINFKYFDDGNLDSPNSKKDLDALIEAVGLVKKMLARSGSSVQATIWPKFLNEDLEDPQVREKLRQFIANETWGHHACGTCKIGKQRTGDNPSVVDGDFKVHDIQGLRIVDASVFPKIPGFFIVTPVYMIAEKAATVILRDAKAATV